MQKGTNMHTMPTQSNNQPPTQPPQKIPPNQQAAQVGQTQAPTQQLSTPQKPMYQNTNTGNHMNNSQSNFKSKLSALSLPQKFWIGVVTVLLVIGSFTILPSLILRPSIITVIGSGEIDVPAEKVSMVVTISTTGSDSVNTINEAEILTNLLIDSTKSVLGMDDPKITKAFYQVQPIPQANGFTYQVINAFSVETSQIDKTNELIKTLYRDGATSVSNVSFTASNEETTALEARKLAVEDAKTQARSIAKTAGKRVGRIVSLTDDNLPSTSAVTNVNDQSQNFSNVTVSKLVSVSYEIW